MEITHFVARSARDALSPALPRSRNRRGAIQSDRRHLEAAVDWLKRSIELHGGNGSAHSYRLFKGWMPPYPETSGYILKTFLRLYAKDMGNRHLETAKGLGNWLLSLQLDDGGFEGSYVGHLNRPVVFNTGQILLGMNALHEATCDQRYLESARRAASFLVECMDDDGCFRRYTSNGIVHTYNARTAWALIETGTIAGEERFVDAGRRNLQWALAQQSDNGFFRQNNFKPDGNANLHGLSYVLRGLTESYELTDDEEYLAAVVKTLDQAVALYERHGMIAGEFDEEWRYLCRYVCLTGYCQMAIVLMKAFQIVDDRRYLKLARRMVDDVKSTQDIRSEGKPHYGAISGSYPIFGRYATMQYPNWATKFFVDSLLLKMQLERADELRSRESDIPIEPTDAIPA